jgi:predicted transcriptional regulator of viral defense system
MAEKDSEIVRIFREHQGILRMSQALELGIPRHKLYQLRDAGMLVQEHRGFYRLEDMDLDWNQDYLFIQQRIPKGILSLTSALHVHQLTTQIPDHICLTLPRGTKKPAITYPLIEFVWQSEPAYSSGIEEKAADHFMIRVYNREKTITDCFKFRNKVGLNVAIEALKDYLNQPGVNLRSIQKYAEINRVKRIITPYIEALV